MLRVQGFPEAIPELVEEAGRVGDIAIRRAVGSGTRSAVFEAADATTGMPVALKRISKTAVTSLAELRDVAMELRALRVLSGGDGFLEFRDVLATRRYVYFVLERFGAAPRRPKAPFRV